MKHPNLAPTPPMGWNSWTAFCAFVSEKDVFEVADAFARDFLPLGYDTITVDGGWMFAMSEGGYSVDEYGRYRPDPERFPSCAESRGFLPLADALHARGLKLGIHSLRGVPRWAADAKVPILGSQWRCDEIANRADTCTWNTMCFGTHPEHPGTADWYDSHFALWAEWEVDFVKLDDLSSPYHQAEAEIIVQACRRSGRPMVLSFSPGNDTPLDAAAHLQSHAHLWRITLDMWDRWQDVVVAFDRLAAWAPYAQPGAWPDADILPIGRISIFGSEHGLSERRSLLTPDEQRSVMTLWCIARSPLFMGAHLPSLTEQERALLTHPALIALNQRGEHPRETHRDDRRCIWETTLDGRPYTAVFNLSDDPHPFAAGPWRDVWADHPAEAPLTVPPHGVRLLTPEL